MKKEREPEPEIDESLLTPGQKAEMQKHLFTWKWALWWGILIALIVVCIIVIAVLNH